MIAPLTLIPTHTLWFQAICPSKYHHAHTYSHTYSPRKSTTFLLPILSTYQTLFAVLSEALGIIVTDALTANTVPHTRTEDRGRVSRALGECHVHGIDTERGIGPALTGSSAVTIITLTAGASASPLACKNEWSANQIWNLWIKREDQLKRTDQYGQVNYISLALNLTQDYYH